MILQASSRRINERTKTRPLQLTFDLADRCSR
jgi:hypothetical protein